jgi:hypothetical protein
MFTLGLFDRVFIHVSIYIIDIFRAGVTYYTIIMNPVNSMGITSEP